MRRSRTHAANPWCRLIVLAVLGPLAPAVARAQAQLPDLIVTDFEEQKGVISFTLRNDGTKTAPAGHTAYLNVDGHDVDTAYVAVTIVPGKTYTGTFNKYSWKCTSGKHTLVVRADGTDKVAESNEKNNSREEVWTCDATAPVITAGPTVTNITETSARVRWTTDESSDSVVHYGLMPIQYTGMKSSKTPTTDHSILLDGLQADTRYYFAVESTDAAGNTVRSKEANFRTQAEQPQLPDLIVTAVWESAHLIHFRVQNAGDNTAGGGHRAGLYVAGRLIDSLLITQSLAPGEWTERNFEKFYFECFDPQQTLRVAVDIDDAITEQNETNNDTEQTFTCDVTPPKIVSGPSVQEITTKSAALVWETDEACDSEVLYDSQSSTFGQQATDAARGTQHRISLGKLTPDTVYQFKVRSTDAAGLSVSSHPGYFRTDPKAGGQAPVVKKVSFRRLDTQFLAYALEADVVDDATVDKVEFFVDDMLLCTDYSPPYEAVLAPGIIATTRAEFFQRRPVRVVATDTSNMRGSLAGMFEPAYECEQIHAEFEWPFPNEKFYIPGNIAPAGTEVPVRVYAYAWESDCHVLTGSLGGLAESLGESAIICDFEENPVREVEFSINGSPIGVVPSGGGYVYSITWDATGFPLGEHSIRADVVGDDDCIQTITRTIEIERGTLELDVTRRVWREGNAFRIELTVHNHGTLDYACDVIHDNLIGLFAVPETYGHHEVIPMAGAGAGDCDVYLDLFDDGDNTRLIRAGHSVAVEYHAVPTLTNSYPGWADRPIGREAVEVLSSWGLPGQTFERPCVRTEDGLLLTNELDTAVATADFLLVTNWDNCQTEFGSADSVVEEMAALAYHRNGVLGCLDNWIPTGFSVPSATTIRDQIAAWGATMRGSDGAAGGYLSNGYLLLVGETEIVPAWTVDIPDIEWTNVEDPTTEVTLSDLPYGDTSGADNVPELFVGRIIGNRAGALVQAMQASLDGGFDRSYGVVTSGYETDWEDFVLTAQDIYRVWFDQAGDGESMTDAQRMHHWSAYVQKEELVSGYDFPMSADEGFVMANLGGAVTALRVDPATDTAHGAAHSDMGLVASHFSVEFACPFDAGDGLAAGDIDGDGADEIVRAAIGTDELMVVHDPPTTDHGAYVAADVALAPWDAIACGDVLGLGDDQVVLARTTGGGSIRIYEYDHTGVRRLVNTHSFSVPFSSYDSLAVGDVNATNPGDEIIVARDDGSRIYIYDSSGNTLGEIACECYTGNDGLVANDLDGDGKDEIGIVIDDTVDSKRRLKVFQHDCWSLDPNGIWQVKDDKSFLIYSRFLHFDGARTTGGSCHDGISCADLDGDGREEICIAHEHDDRLYVCDGYYSRGWKDRYLPVLQDIDDQIDVFAMSGHGNAGSCSPLNRDDVNSLSLDAHPVVFAFSCLTGNYEGAGDNGLAETFLSRGAGVYIGATEVSPTTENSAAGPAFFSAWTPGDPVGKAFGNFRRGRAATGDEGWRFWALEYNYYGDPKFGAADSATASAEPAGTGIAIAAAPPLPGLNEAITIPPYEVTTANGQDRATIPGGDVLLEDGKPPVPYYTKQWELPPGTVVQDVQLRQRSGRKTDVGLVLPMVVARVDAAGAPAPAPAEPEPSWYPRKDLDWRLVPNPNGSTTLLVSLYPFFYNSLTTEVRFYQEYVIDVVTTVSNVSIVSLATDAVRYQPGDPVTAHLQLFGTGAAEDVFVDVAIRQYGSDELIAGLLLRRLSALSGPASFSPVWDSRGASAGLYYVDVTLAKPAGEVLARRQSLFELAADAQPGDVK